MFASWISRCFVRDASGDAENTIPLERRVRNVRQPCPRMAVLARNKEEGWERSADFITLAHHYTDGATIRRIFEVTLDEDHAAQLYQCRELQVQYSIRIIILSALFSDHAFSEMGVVAIFPKSMLPTSFDGRYSSTTPRHCICQSLDEELPICLPNAWWLVLQHHMGGKHNAKDSYLPD